jgi:glutamate dehydrogenase
MAGDVFGNGMLMSPHIKLVAAFNHKHIFIDPNPDPAISYAERKRLFDLPRSNWSDYNATLISKGGGVYERSAKSIRLTPEMKIAFNLQGDYLVPNDLIHAILQSPVDLIWNGGIGTFVKSSKEDNLNAGDRANDAIRVNANALKAKMIAEGGNLGMTQLARIEYSLHGGIVNTDFIDNSAGVDCSDHEVNIKILLNQMIMAKKMTKPDRNKLLKKMTQEVADLVLQDNYEQTQIISLEISQAQHKMDLFRHYMNELEKQNRLNRSLEYLPTDAEMIERKANNQPLTRPEIAVLLAYSKMYLKKDILPIDLLDEPYFDKYLFSAFPAILEQKFSTELKKHSLRKEIIATQLTKSIVDRMGVHFVERLHQETGASTEFIIKAFVIAQEVFQMNSLWNQITALDYQINSEVQYRMMLQVYYLIRRSTRWLLRNRKPNLHIQRTIDTLTPPIQELSEHLTNFLDDAGREGLGHVVSYYLDQGVPEKLAKQIASCNALFTAFDITEAAHKDQLDLAETAKTYYRLGQQLELNTLRDLMNAYPIDNTWDELARAGFRDDIDRVQRKLTARLLTRKATDLKRKNLDDCIHAWIHRHAFLTGRWKTLLAELKASEVVGFVKYSVVLRELFDFAQAA